MFAWKEAHAFDLERPSPWTWPLIGVRVVLIYRAGGMLAVPAGHWYQNAHRGCPVASAWVGGLKPFLVA